jgi:hypothetical protein
MTPEEIAAKEKALKEKEDALNTRETTLQKDENARQLQAAETMIDGHVARGAVLPADKQAHLDACKNAESIGSAAAILNTRLLAIPDKAAYDPGDKPASTGDTLPAVDALKIPKTDTGTSLDIDQMILAEMKENGNNYGEARRTVQKRVGSDAMEAHEKGDPKSSDVSPSADWTGVFSLPFPGYGRQPVGKEA